MVTGARREEDEKLMITREIVRIEQARTKGARKVLARGCVVDEDAFGDTGAEGGEYGCLISEQGGDGEGRGRMRSSITGEGGRGKGNGRRLRI